MRKIPEITKGVQVVSEYGSMIQKEMSCQSQTAGQRLLELSGFLFEFAPGELRSTIWREPLSRS